jgi:hypothetical protein
LEGREAGDLPARGKAPESNPTHHSTPELFQPLWPVMVVAKTKSAELLGEKTTKTTMKTTKRAMWRMPPMTSKGARTLLAKMLQKRGRARIAHANKVPWYF